jgi:hypothetical protein
MEKINGIPMIPFGLLGGFCDGLEIRITELAEEGFSFRVPEKLEKVACLEICFFDFSAGGYHKISLAENDRKIELTEETPFFFTYSVWTKKEAYREQVNRLVKGYDHYISLKLTGDDAYLSEKMVGYPAELDEIYAEDFAEQKKEWFCYNEDREYPEFDLAITLDRPKLYQAFLEKDWTNFCEDYWKENFLEHHPLHKKRITRIYVGNQFCHNLFPEKKQLFQILDKAAENQLCVTIAFSYIRDNLLEETGELLQKLEVWCQSRDLGMADTIRDADTKNAAWCEESDRESSQIKLEIIVNDWAMPALLKGKAHLIPVLGILLNKRRKDVRLPYVTAKSRDVLCDTKSGAGQECTVVEKGVARLAENNLNCGFYQNYLNHTFNIQRYEFESCGYQIAIPEGRHSLHLPFFQTNTSQYCTLYAVCRYGDRGKQHLPENCPRYCETKVFLYPKHLKMVGRYNSLFGYDDTILWDETLLKQYLENGIDRVVLNISL